MKSIVNPYLNQLHQAYRGELYGIAFFQQLLEYQQCLADVNSRAILSLTNLLEIEHITACKLYSSLTALSVPCEKQDDAMTQRGVTDASRWQALPWNKLTDTLLNWVEPYQGQYQQQANSAEEFHELFDLVNEHETCIYQFLLSEQKNESNAQEKLQGFINKHQR